jgi:hypothetical protein
MGIFDKARDPLRDHTGRIDPEVDERSGRTHRALDRDADQAADELPRDRPAEEDRPR